MRSPRLLVLSLSCLLFASIGCLGSSIPGGETPDFCQSTSDCSTGKTCLNRICVVSVMNTDNPPWSEVPASECVKGDKRACALANGKGICKNGRQLCESKNGWRWGKCIPVEPTTEECNDDDDDCDGLVDNQVPGMGEACKDPKRKGICSQGTKRCIDGQVICVQNDQPAKFETCDGKDNDCDGDVDEGIEWSGRPCTSQRKGLCKPGKRVCQNGRAVCAPTVQPKKEVCDGVDNNCDGQIDEGCPCQVGETQRCFSGGRGCPQDSDVCLGECQKGTRSCQNGVWGKCEGEVLSTNEVCDGKDNNCDGQIDDGLNRNCYNGPQNTRGVGVCSHGIQTCSLAKWGECVGQITPTKEICDGKDNDCDGKTDEGFGKLGFTCEVGVGSCRGFGKIICSEDGLGEICNAKEGTKSPEICDAIDNDCDGSVDEGFDVGSSCLSGLGECAKTGKKICLPSGRKTVCDAVPGVPYPEKCDQRDNNCDGLVDNKAGGCFCTTGDQRKCFTGQSSNRGVGECKEGSQKCIAGRWSRCQGDKLPTDEKCDNKDNDCDGLVDEELKRRCFSGNYGCKQDLSKPIDSPERYKCEGECAPGTSTCKSGVWGACTGSKIPVSETCDDKDNDCDGKIDETWSNKGAACAVGAGECRRTSVWKCASDGKGLTCHAIVGTPVAEVCDGKDNDCDGKIDESHLDNRVNHDVGTSCRVPNGKKGVCGEGTYKCLNTQLGYKFECVPNGTTPSSETCDGKDNDCDGYIDEICRFVGIPYAMVNGNGTVAKARLFNTTPVSVGAGVVTVFSHDANQYNCSNRIILATPNSSQTAAATYTCDGKGFRIHTFEGLGSSGLSQKSIPFHVVRPVPGTGLYGHVACKRDAQSQQITCSIQSATSNDPTAKIVRIEARQGLISLSGRPCNDTRQPIFAMLRGSDAGSIQVSSAGTRIVNFRSIGRCDFQMFDASGKPTLRDFVYWLPSTDRFQWMSIDQNGALSRQSNQHLSLFLRNITNPDDTWTMSHASSVGRFSHYEVAHRAWMAPSAVLLTPRLFSPGATNPAASASFWIPANVNHNINVHTTRYRPTSTDSAAKSGVHVMYIHTKP